MHELSLAEALIDQILAVAKENNLAKVDEVIIETGVLKQVVPEMMQEAFFAVSDETIAEGSKLTIIETSAKAKCRKCEQEFEPEIDSFLCPDCQVASVDILKGNDIILKSVIFNG
jgi:hydrogenase nickel incorporation protein HypA/HybF